MNEVASPPQGFAIAATVCGVISIVFLAPVFSTLGFIFGLIGLNQGERVLSIIGIVTAIIGALTSPILWSMALWLLVFLGLVSGAGAIAG